MKWWCSNCLKNATLQSIWNLKSEHRSRQETRNLVSIKWVFSNAAVVKAIIFWRFCSWWQSFSSRQAALIWGLCAGKVAALWWEVGARYRGDWTQQAVMVLVQAIRRVYMGVWNVSSTAVKPNRGNDVTGLWVIPRWTKSQNQLELRWTWMNY